MNPDVPTPDTDAPLVSVVMPVYNAEATMVRSIESVLGQSHRQVELILVNDGSRDGSATIMDAYAARDARVVVVHQANGGVAAARNRGLQEARGTHVAFLDSDDWWDPDKLALQLAHMARTGARVCYTAYQRVAEDGRALTMVVPPARVDYAGMLYSNHIGNLTGIYTRSLGEVAFQRMGHEDYVFWLDRVRRAGHAERVPDPRPLAYYLVRGGSVSANKLRAAGWQWRIYRQIEGLTLPRSAWCMLHYMAHALRKRSPVSRPA
ncbi:glycosyltransferase family 2 protein [Pseudoxanthomonas sp. Root630]|uniref:glycosyltransferase family 2 protein n=1 Tax=Pseudoxanthomonas sp. Root630 TaxID=1736574 RepID=UPI0009D665D3|nr:glycosyltransferase family 2 protein [Pseudoxanthomonas sp. Root630]